MNGASCARLRSTVKQWKRELASTELYAGGGGHGGNTKSSGDTVINNGKYKKACKVNGGNYQDSVNWPATFKGKTIKNYCPWVHKQKNPVTYCKQKQNNVLVSTACPCACAGY